MLKHVSFVTPKADAIQEFYTELGAQLDKDVTAPDGLRRLVLRFENGGQLQFFVTDQMSPTVGAEWLEHIAVELTDFEVGVQAMRALRAPFIREVETLPSGRRVTFVLDPDGRHVELLEQR